MIRGSLPATCDISLHLLWLPDGVGHASTIVSNLDMTQKELIKKSKEYSKIFTDLYLRTIEYNGYTRTGICDFPALRKHNMDANEIMECYYLAKLSMVSDTQKPRCDPTKPRLQ